MDRSEGPRRPSRTLCRTLFLVAICLTTLVVATEAQSCSSNALLPAEVTQSVTVNKCQDVWSSRNYTFHFQMDLTANTLSVVLSVPKDNRWYGIGFHNQPKMIGSSAVIGWVDPTKAVGNAKLYYLKNQDSQDVYQDPNSTRLVFKTQPFLIDTNDAYYVAFEIDVSKSTDSISYIVLAIGSAGDIPSPSVNQHEDETTLQMDYQSGTSSVVNTNVDSQARTHGLLNIFGWGILLPVGAIIARYAREYDPTWFFAHAGIQSVGFIFVIAGIVTGMKLGDKVSVSYDSHQALGIFLLVVAIFQVSAVVIRPSKDAKVRRFWNWAHWWLGRLGLFLGAINIYVGIHVASASKRWKAGYAIVIALELIVVIILETLYWIKHVRSSNEPHLPQTAMQRRDTANFDSSPPRAPPPPYNWEGK